MTKPQAYCLRLRDLSLFWPLFHNDVDDLSRHEDLFDDLLSFEEGSNSVIGLCCCHCGVLITSRGDGHSSADFAVDLNAYFYSSVDGLGLIIIRPCGYGEESLSSDQLVDLLRDMRSEGRKELEEDRKILFGDPVLLIDLIEER